MEYMSASETAEKWQVSIRQVQKLCAAGRVVGAQRLGNGKVWIIPKHAEKPWDARNRRANSNE